MDINNIVTFLNSNSGALNVVFAAIVTTATVVYSILTWKLVTETRRMRKAQTDARVSISLSVSEKWVNLIDLVVRNEGVGPAFDIKFAVNVFNREEFDKKLLQTIDKLGFLQKGIPYLSPGQEVHSFLTSMTDNYEKKREAVIEVIIVYRTSSGDTATERYILDFSIFEGLRRLGTPPLHSIAASLEKIEKNIGNLSSGFNRLKVIAYTKSDIDAEDKEWMEEVERFEAEAGAQAVTEEKPEEATE